MITTFFINLGNSMLQWFLSQRPAWDPQLPDGVSQFIAFAESYDNIFPVNECLAVLGTLTTGVLVFVIVKWGVKLVDWVTNLIP
jgi:hypothetical protein